ncbi:MAG: hypothetical protein GY898_07255 [Proteobacteria bacterium]|nr:hypothetical protein [Pseudomonadota bacterium]
MRLPAALALSALFALPMLLSGDAPLQPSEADAAGAAGVRMEILVDGRVAREYDGRSKTYIQAYKGKEYSIRLSNDTGSRVAVALSVDGFNTIDAKRTSAVEAAKWVLGPWEQVTVTGWQVGSDHARQFVFTNEESSYGEWLGQTRNLGNISAAFFGEVPYYDPCCGPDGPVPLTRGEDDYDGRFGDAGGSSRRDREAPRRSEPMAEAESVEESRPSSRSSSKSGGGAADASSGDSAYGYERKAPKKKERAATGTGRRTRNSVEWVAFDLDPTPLVSMSLRYGFRDELVELGVLPKPRPRDYSLSRRESGSGFAPDPGSRCCR